MKIRITEKVELLGLLIRVVICVPKIIIKQLTLKKMCLKIITICSHVAYALCSLYKYKDKFSPLIKHEKLQSITYFLSMLR